MVVKRIIPLLVFVMSFLLCNDGSPIGSNPVEASSESGSIDSDGNETQLIDPDKIQGKWKFLAKTQTWNSKTEPVRMTGMEFFFVIDENSVVSWLYYPLFPNSSNCLNRTVSDYTLKGNRMFGENFDGEKEQDGQVLSWSTLVEMAGDNLYIITNYKEGESKSWSETMEFEPYNGVVPPEEWPDEECSEGMLEKRNQ
jgi:hypothetical protein